MMVHPDPKLNDLLKQPHEAVEYFFKEDISRLKLDSVKELNHLYALNVIVFEICYMASGVKMTTLLEEAYDKWNVKKLLKNMNEEMVDFEKNYEIQCIDCGL